MRPGSASLLVLILTVTPALHTSATDSPSSATERPETVGVFTGRYSNGVPVYQFPAVTVVAHRKVELARLSREARPASKGKKA